MEGSSDQRSAVYDKMTIRLALRITSAINTLSAIAEKGKSSEPVIRGRLVEVVLPESTKPTMNSHSQNRKGSKLGQASTAALLFFSAMGYCSSNLPQARITTDLNANGTVSFSVIERHYAQVIEISITDVASGEKMWDVFFPPDRWSGKPTPDHFFYGQIFAGTDLKLPPKPLLSGMRYRLHILAGKGNVHNPMEFTMP